MSLIERIIVEAKNMLIARKEILESTHESKELENYFIDVDLKVGGGFQTEDTLVFIAPYENNKFDKIKNDVLQYLFFILQTLNLKNCVLIYDTIAPLANDIIKTHSVYSFQTFHYKHLLFNPIQHKFVPKHTLLSLQEINDLNLRKLPDQTLKDILPHILIDDRIVKYYDWKVGDVIKITRTDSIYYRIVV